MSQQGNLAVAPGVSVNHGANENTVPLAGRATSRHDRHRAWARVAAQADVRAITHRHLCTLADELRRHGAISTDDYALLTSVPPWLFDRKRDCLALWQTRLEMHKTKRNGAEMQRRIWRVLDILNYWISLRAM